MDSPGSRLGGRARVAPPADGLVLYRRARSSWRSVQSSESNELPASQPASPRPAGCPEKERTRRCKYRAPSAGVWCREGAQPNQEEVRGAGMNEILRDIPPRRGVLPIPGPARGSPRVDETFPETGE